MKTHLSPHIFPLHVGCNILGHDLVCRMVDSLLRLRDATSSGRTSSTVMDTESLVESMFFSTDAAISLDESNNSSTSLSRLAPQPIVTAWKQLWTAKTLLLDKSSILPFLIPQVLNGHQGLLDCWMWALGGGATIRLPDVIIFLAVCHQYTDGDKDDKQIVWNMSVMTYRVLECYLKRENTVSRDTLHRFLQDIYGDACAKQYKEPLDAMYCSDELHAILTQDQFCRGVAMTDTKTRGMLLDWLAGMGVALTPAAEAAETVTAYTETITAATTSQVLRQRYGLNETNTFAAKRRFHSLVQQQPHAASNHVVQGDPMWGGTDSKTASTPAAIMAQTLTQALSEPGNIAEGEVYVSTALAARWITRPWTLVDVLEFGAVAVRDEPDAIWKYVGQIVCGNDEGATTTTLEIWERRHIKTLLEIILRHAMFREKMDRPKNCLDEEDEGEDVESDGIFLASAVDLGLTDPSPGARPTDPVDIDTLVENMMGDSETWEVADLIRWNARTGDARLGGAALLLLELRLVAAVFFGIPPRVSYELELIGELDRRHRKRFPGTEVARRGPRGTVWYIMDALWLKDWTKQATRANTNRSDKSQHPISKKLPPISNAHLLVDNGSLELRPEIRWKHDYELVPPLTWSALAAWYDGGPPIHRSVVQYDGAQGYHTAAATVPTEFEIELYPYFVSIYLCDTASQGEPRPFSQNFQLSRVSSTRRVLVHLCQQLDIEPSSARVWVLEVNGQDWILELEKSVTEQRKKRGSSQSDDNIRLLLELKDRETGVWPRGVDGKQIPQQVGPPRSALGDGIVGLYNMGNTCYLNSSIQCLSHTPILREYFTSKGYLRDINRTNPLGYKGHLAQVSAVLMNELWRRSNPVMGTLAPKGVTAPGSYLPLTNAPALTPKTFKDSLGTFNELFAGNEQHDAQELLAFLLGGLSEDLNRIVEKPYLEAPDSDGRPDSELADIWWSNHLKREMSIIVALFTGQYKSLLTCRTCKYESARFEPFSFLQLPLPENDHLQSFLTFYPAKEGAGPMKYGVRVHGDGTLNDLLVELARILHNDETGESTPPIERQVSADEVDENKNAIFEDRARDMAIVLMREGYISKKVSSDMLIRDNQLRDSGELPHLYIYDLAPLPADLEEPEVSYITVCQRRPYLLSQDFLHPLTLRVFGIPLLLRLIDVEKYSGREIYDLIATRLRTLVPKEAVRFLDAVEANDTQTEEPESRRETEESIERSNTESCKTTCDMEVVSAGPVPRYGFRIRRTSRDGRRCQSCLWYDCCIGCLIADTDAPAGLTHEITLSVDWHFAVDIATNGFGTRVPQPDPTLLRPIRTVRNPIPIQIPHHSSCGTNKKNASAPGAVTLEACLDAFAKEEKIPEAYCSKCKDFRVQTKRMSLWRLPPVMIIHLKRFQFTQTMRRKLRDLVVFPIEGLDLSRIMAQSDASATADISKTDAAEAESEGETDGDQQDGGKADELKDSGRSEMLYDLYGVIHHQGALSTGHYVASLKSEIDGQWRLFNDAQIFDIHARDVVDPSAYILFYIRRDVAAAELSDYWDINAGNPLSDEDMDQLLKGRSDRCSIS